MREKVPGKAFDTECSAWKRLCTPISLLHRCVVKLSPSHSPPMQVNDVTFFCVTTEQARRRTWHLLELLCHCSKDAFSVLPIKGDSHMILHTGHGVTIEVIPEVQALRASLRGRFGNAPARHKMAVSQPQQAVAVHPWTAIRPPSLIMLKQ